MTNIGTFAYAVANQETRTANGMKTNVSSSSKCVDLFYKIGAMRGKNIIPDFVAAYVENPELAIRVVLWSRDARSGAGERKIFRDILTYCADNYPVAAYGLISKAADLGRWDDLLLVLEEKYQENSFHNLALRMIYDGLFVQKNGLCAKWMPRRGDKAEYIRRAFHLTPRQYRKWIVGLSSTVETQMSAKAWEEINYSHVPSNASKIYRKAFARHDPVRYNAWREGLAKGETKVNSSVLYPYQVIETLKGYNSDKKLGVAMWEALPNYMGEDSVLPMVDVSGSMTTYIPGSKSLVLDVALSLGLYVADKNKGAFKDTFLTFSASPILVSLKGDISEKLAQMNNSSKWGHGMNTNLHSAFDTILEVAVRNSVRPEEMPKTLLILSDMQFDACVRFDDSAIQMIRRKYEQAGYAVPKIVFWNLNSGSGTPVKFNEQGTALVSGFSPAIMKSILAGDDFTPQGIMLKTIMDERYNFLYSE